MQPQPEKRDVRRKERTRAALVRAAQEMLAGDAGDRAISIQSITDRADVGFGSFYNHFESKTELFDIAIEEASRDYEIWLDNQLGGEADPMRRLALSIRLTGRLHRTHPDLANLLIKQPGPDAGKGALPSRARKDVVAAIQTIPDDEQKARPTDVTVISASGAIAAVLRASVGLPDDARVALADGLAADILRLLGVADAVIFDLINEPLA